MDWADDEQPWGGHGGDSDLSVTTCNAGASSLSVALCDID
jgi:hypothetical protein